MANFKNKITVDISNIRKNAHYLRSLTSHQSQMAVVKADAYGLGAVEIANSLENEVRYFGVATMQEAIELRESGIKKEIVVFAPVIKEEVSLFYKYRVEPILSRVTDLFLFQNPIKVHVQLDSGMFRNGLPLEEWNEFWRIVMKPEHRHIDTVGVCTHFATASDPDDPFVETQLSIFRDCLNRVDDSESKIIHAANSGGTLFYPNSHFDMIRTGIALYGFTPGKTENANLRPSLKLESFVIHSKQIKKGTGVGYDLNWIANDDGFISVVPIGFADGVSRQLNNKIPILLNGESVQHAGNVTMDYIMVFSKQRPSIGDKVELIGDQFGVKQWANLMDTTPYEVLTNFSHRVRIDKAFESN